MDNQYLLNRLLAKAIDLIIVLALAGTDQLVGIAGPLAALLYVLIADGLFGGRSIGKRIVQLKVVNITSNKPCSFKDSMIRNAPLGVGVFFYIIPFWGWVLWLVIGIPIVIMEIYLMKSLENYTRLGDTMAETQVLEDKE